MKYKAIFTCLFAALSLTGCLVSKDPMIGGDAIITPTKGGLYEKCDFAVDGKEYYACDYVTVGLSSNGSYAAMNIFNTSSEVFVLGRMQDTNKWAIQYSAGNGSYQYGMAQETDGGLLAIFPMCNAMTREVVNDYGNRGYITHMDGSACYIRDASALVQIFKELPSRIGNEWLKGATIKKMTPLTDSAALKRAADYGFNRFKGNYDVSLWFMAIRDGALFAARFPQDRRLPEVRKMLQNALQQDKNTPYKNNKGKYVQADPFSRGLATSLLGDIETGFSVAMNAYQGESHNMSHASQSLLLITEMANRTNHPKRKELMNKACRVLSDALRNPEVISDPSEYVPVDAVRQQLSCG